MPTPLLKRLTQQLSAGGNKHPKDMAVAILEKRGQMKNGVLTAEGRKREELGAAGRAKDRAAKRLGGSPSDYVYNSRTNTARKK